jgi:hypothetical protein
MFVGSESGSAPVLYISTSRAVLETPKFFKLATRVKTAA